MPAEEETTSVTVSATMPHTESPIKQPTNVDDILNAEESPMNPVAEPVTEPVEKSTETAKNEVPREEEKKNEVEQEESKSKDDENKENAQENGPTVENDATGAVETKGKPEGVVLRKRRTPEKESNDEGVSPPKKAVK